jgi:D-lactate dehydrogenase
MLTKPYRQLYNRLIETLPAGRLLHDDLSLLAFGADASFYRLTPQLVVKVHSEAEAVAVIRSCYDLRIPLTIRASGTSLSGQAIGNSVLMVIVGSEWKNFSVKEDGSEITVQPGATGGQVNQILAAFRKRIGPDPASINSVQIGGIVANNASGMTSGIRDNSYNSLTGLRVVFNDGVILDTADPASRTDFMIKRSGLVNRLLNLADRARSNPQTVARIREKYQIKNTTGYGVNSLIDFSDPIDVIMHLMVGSEGTLGFISRLSLRVIDDPPHKASGLVIFKDIACACEAIALLRQCRVNAAELMDRASLRSVEDKAGMPARLKTLPEPATALLIETSAANAADLEAQIHKIISTLKADELLSPAEFTSDAKTSLDLWNVRKGLFPSVCANRRKGTTVIIEDIAVPYPSLAQALIELQGLFKKYNYDDAIIWGHALDGNVHFVLIQDFSDAEEALRYEAFMNELVALIVDKYNGSLKGEHGTGRNMAPFVRREWGDEIYEIMREIKAIFDPEQLFNPGVIFNPDARIHLKNLKPMPQAHDLIDACIECGFCEINCVSRDLTLSPRQRIVAFRQIAYLKRTGREPHVLSRLLDRYDYKVNQTCATDGLCALSCPVNIDTGKLIKELRHDQLSPGALRTAEWIAAHMAIVTAAARFGLKTLHFIHRLAGSNLMTATAVFLRKLSGKRLPRWTPFMPLGAENIKPRSIVSGNPRRVIYFPSCITRSMGAAADNKKAQTLTEKTIRLLEKAGYSAIFPEKLNTLCCGMAFASKGFKEIGERKARELETALLQASDNGQIPVLCDMSPCLYHMKETLDKRLILFEPIEFTLEFLTPRLDFRPLPKTVAIHTVCSAKKMGLDEKFVQLAGMCAEKIIMPESNCCGFAGDRGFTVPELNASGLRHLREQITPGCSEGYSTSRTCEIGLSEHGGIPYRSILYLVDECTTAKQNT